MHRAFGPKTDAFQKGLGKLVRRPILGPVFLRKVKKKRVPARRDRNSPVGCPKFLRLEIRRPTAVPHVSVLSVLELYSAGIVGDKIVQNGEKSDYLRYKRYGLTSERSSRAKQSVKNKASKEDCCVRKSESQTCTRGWNRL